MPDYDVIVLGGGSAGTSAASAAVSAGARTAMVNDGELGGLCILRGCMPTKAMLASAHAVHLAEHLEPFGATLDGRVVVDFGRVVARKDAQVARFQRAKIASVQAADYELVSGRGRFVAGGGLEVDGRPLTAATYVVATGSVPVILPIPGVEQVPLLTSDEVMRLRKAPRRLVVQGAGPIGLELAQFFARIGTEVLLVNRSPLLSRYDAEAGAELQQALGDEPRLELAVPATIDELHPENDGLVAVIRQQGERREHRADALLMAAGRRAALDDLGLEHAGVTPAEGRIDHDSCMRTRNPHLYVAGDASGTHQILHLSNQEGRVAGHNAAGGSLERHMDYRLLMQVIFTDPPYAQVGATEDEAARAGRDVVTACARFPETGRAITMGVRYGVWKLLADRGSGEILGASLVGPRADDLGHLVTSLMHFGGTVSDLLELPWYHPTLSEVMIELARDLDRQISRTKRF